MILDFNWILIVSLFFIFISFGIMRLSKKNTKKGYILIGIISLVSILIYFLFPILLTNNFVYDVGIISLFISLLVGNFIGIFIEKKLKRKPKRK